MAKEYYNKTRREWASVATYYDISGEITGEEYSIVELCAYCRADCTSKGQYTQFAEEATSEKTCALCEGH